MKRKVPISIRLPEELVERAKNAAFWTGQGVTFNSLIESGLVAAVENIEESNGGKPFKQRTGELPKSPKG